ncbi:hexose kinase [Virgibacillus pantothenticus]|uniref:Tagatose-6-phosphate kinase n=1 Tax=Virgibacillus pantothenticus TaxID=1473 RepID=A0A0L0QTU6_VIRPA|nr:hexose kinase [Virgibacillus pantothenticus]KNE21628.1 tagatose-6-phosphate kinase [Virgibacillus pantothenticus]MBU8566647.1 hexose kinase [Virgibacillus pantothenticus]MBU8599138.1 hexose kinase [Virgibacillus pantothenticus]MBU8634803.1 hexose kinase [Virgibacillus pantothenticus]MBU8641114.1 hexose kinase [Virgibacillus pantothenticus]
MIFTITLNPSVDIQYRVADFKENTVNRVADVSKTAGGKGLNVARVIRQLDEPVAASGLLGGSLGDFISKELKRLDIQNDFMAIEGDTRNCIAIIHDGKQTEILESGPVIQEKEANGFLTTFRELAEQANWITVSGSLPKGLPDDYYQEMLAIAKEVGTPVLLDTKGDLLARALQSETPPYLMKPNQDELADLLGKETLCIEDIKAAVQSPLFAGVEWVVVTLGELGAVVKHKDKAYRVQSPKINAVNPVGSGDSVIAGFATGLARQLGGEKLMKFGLTMGVLNAMEEQTGYIDTSKIVWCMEQMEVMEI